MATLKTLFAQTVGSCRMPAILLILSLLPVCLQADGWPVWGGNAAGTRYSSLAQINTKNVDDLEIAWQIRTGALAKYGEQLGQDAGFQVNPILTPAEAGQLLVLCTPYNEVIALDPVTGERRWTVDPDIRMGGYGSTALWQPPRTPGSWVSVPSKPERFASKPSWREAAFALEKKAPPGLQRGSLIAHQSITLPRCGSNRAGRFLTMAV